MEDVKCVWFSRTYNLIRFIVWIRVKMQFLLKCQLSNFLEVRIQFISRVVNIKKPWKKRSVVSKDLTCRIQRLDPLVSCLCALKRTVDPTLTFEKHRTEFPSKLKFDHLKIPFAHSLLGRFLVKKKFIFNSI